MTIAYLKDGLVFYFGHSFAESFALQCIPRHFASAFRQATAESRINPPKDAKKGIASASSEKIDRNGERKPAAEERVTENLISCGKIVRHTMKKLGGGHTAMEFLHGRGFALWAWLVWITNINPC